MDMITLEAQANKAFDYLRETDEEHARLRSELEMQREMRKAIESTVFLTFDGTAAERAHRAKASSEYQDQLESIKDLELAYFEIDNKRKRAFAQIDWFRTLSANIRKN